MKGNERALFGASYLASGVETYVYKHAHALTITAHVHTQTHTQPVMVHNYQINMYQKFIVAEDWLEDLGPHFTGITAGIPW